MKLFKFLLVLTMVLFTSAFLVAQTVPPTNPDPGIMDKLFSFASGKWGGFILSFIVGIFAKGGWTIFIKKFANTASTVTKEIGETFIGGSKFFSVLDNSIRADGTLQENSIKDLLQAGKEVVAEANDVIISIKPKPTPPVTP